MERKNLIKNYKKFVHPGKKSLSDVFNEVSAKLDFQPQKLTILTGYFVKTQIHNAVQNIRNRITPYQTQVKLQLYELIQNEKALLTIVIIQKMTSGLVKMNQSFFSWIWILNM